MEYSNAEVVPETNEYRCTGCGTVEVFEEGDDFTLCDACGDEAAGWEIVGSDSDDESLKDESLG